MKNIKKYNHFITMVVYSFLISCHGRDIPIVATQDVVFIGVTVASCGGNVLSEGDAHVSSRGICWSTDSLLNINDNFTRDSSGLGRYWSNMTSLKDTTIYFVRAYATNRFGTGYGEILSFKTHTQNIPTDGLVAHYSFNGNAKDMTNNHNDGNISGAILVIDRLSSPKNAITFDGIDDKITGSVINWPVSNSARTISIWAKIHEPPASNRKICLINYGTGDSQSCGIYLYWFNGYIHDVIFSDGTDELIAHRNIFMYTWFHFVVTFDGTTAKIYINGTLMSEGNKSNWNTVATSFSMGGNNANSYFNGSLDDIRIYNRVVSNEEIGILYNELP